MGIRMSFKEDAYSIKDIFVVQGRNHIITSQTHEQFSKLDGWLEKHREDLESILDPNMNGEERLILYGEWIYARHSIKYSKLPDYFIAYDIYD